MVAGVDRDAELQVDSGALDSVARFRRWRHVAVAAGKLAWAWWTSL
jgi:hypothetical protein